MGQATAESTALPLKEETQAGKQCRPAPEAAKDVVPENMRVPTSMDDLRPDKVCRRRVASTFP